MMNTQTTPMTTEAQQNAALLAACNPERDTKAHALAVAEWNALNDCVGVPYVQMTIDQRMWVNRHAQHIKEGM